MTSIMDGRQISIIMQNAMGHAVNIHINNAKGAEINTPDVIETAKTIAREIYKMAVDIDSKQSSEQKIETKNFKKGF